MFGRKSTIAPLITVLRIAMFDTKTEQFKEWQVAPRWSAPYDVVIDKNEEAWTGSMLSDQVTRLNTKTGASCRARPISGACSWTTARRRSRSGSAATTARRSSKSSRWNNAEEKNSIVGGVARVMSAPYAADERRLVPEIRHDDQAVDLALQKGV